MSPLEKLETELQSLRLLSDPRGLSVDGVKSGELTAERLGQIEMFARRAKELVLQSLNTTKAEENEEKLGQHATVKFTSLNGKEVKAKVDTGATTSSLHAENIKVNSNSTVSFIAPDLSPNTLTMQLVGQQEVHSADGGGNTRPVIQLDIEVDGTPIKDAHFNLNDRSNMDTPILLGQNVLKAGDFVVDVDKGEEESSPDTEDKPEMVAKDTETKVESVLSAEDVMDAIASFEKVLKEALDKGLVKR